MWLITEFEAVTLFSLKVSTATASGGKTLLVPTPYAIKMALLDISCRYLGVAKAKDYWPELRDLAVAISPPQRAVVSNLFQKVLRPRRNPVPMNEPDAGFFQKTIGYREYVYWQGTMGLALGWNDNRARPWLAELMVQVNYLGKRGSLMQMINLPEYFADLPGEYFNFVEPTQQFYIGGTLQLLDDCSSELTFEKANIYNGKNLRMGKDRILRSIVLPYRVQKSSRSFTLYERTDQ
jgi:hypothetical protein